MKLRRFVIVAIALSALCATAHADVKTKLAWGLWGLGKRPVMHSNQDGWIRPKSVAPTSPFGEINSSDRTNPPHPRIFEVALIIDLQMTARNTGDELQILCNQILTNAEPESQSQSTRSVDASVIPAPGVLGLIGLMSLFNVQRRRSKRRRDYS